MYSKTVKYPRTWSLINKLAFFYSLSTIGLVLIVCFILFPPFEKVNHVLSHPNQHYLFDKCIEQLILTILLSVSCAILFGHFIARKSMSSVTILSQKMKKITADSLTHNITLEDWPCELRPLGESFNTMFDNLKKSFNQLSQFSNDIAHELRNPIQNLTGMTETVLSRENSVDAYRDILASHIEEYRHLSKLIENLLFLARKDHGQIVLNKKALNVREEMIKLLDYYQFIADENNVSMHCSGDAVLYADSTLFKRVISNVLLNALRYTHANGTIHIEIIGAPMQTTIAIHDTGIGIEEAHLPHVFDRFYRIDVSRSSETGGLGLGLAIVKSIVELHQGHIRIQSQIGKGTSLHLLFPVLLN